MRTTSPKRRKIVPTVLGPLTGNCVVLSKPMVSTSALPSTIELSEKTAAPLDADGDVAMGLDVSAESSVSISTLLREGGADEEVDLLDLDGDESEAEEDISESEMDEAAMHEWVPHSPGTDTETTRIVLSLNDSDDNVWDLRRVFREHEQLQYFDNEDDDDSEFEDIIFGKYGHWIEGGDDKAQDNEHSVDSAELGTATGGGKAHATENDTYDMNDPFIDDDNVLRRTAAKGPKAKRRRNNGCSSKRSCSEEPLAVRHFVADHIVNLAQHRNGGVALIGSGLLAGGGAMMSEASMLPAEVQLEVQLLSGLVSKTPSALMDAITANLYPAELLRFPHDFVSKFPLHFSVDSDVVAIGNNGNGGAVLLPKRKQRVLNHYREIMAAVLSLDVALSAKGAHKIRRELYTKLQQFLRIPTRVYGGTQNLNSRFEYWMDWFTSDFVDETDEGLRKMKFRWRSNFVKTRLNRVKNRIRTSVKKKVRDEVSLTDETWQRLMPDLLLFCTCAIEKNVIHDVSSAKLESDKMSKKSAVESQLQAVARLFPKPLNVTPILLKYKFEPLLQFTDSSTATGSSGAIATSTSAMTVDIPSAIGSSAVAAVSNHRRVFERFFDLLAICREKLLWSASWGTGMLAASSSLSGAKTQESESARKKLELVCKLVTELKTEHREMTRRNTIAKRREKEKEKKKAAAAAKHAAAATTTVPRSGGFTMPSMTMTTVTSISKDVLAMDATAATGSSTLKADMEVIDLVSSASSTPSKPMRQLLSDDTLLSATGAVSKAMQHLSMKASLSPVSSSSLRTDSGTVAAAPKKRKYNSTLTQMGFSSTSPKKECSGTVDGRHSHKRRSTAAPMAADIATGTSVMAAATVLPATSCSSENAATTKPRRIRALFGDAINTPIWSANFASEMAVRHSKWEDFHFM